MKSFAQLIFIAALVVFITSCKTSFRISVRRPPAVQLDESVQTFLILNNVTEQNSPDKLLQQVLQGQQYNGNVVAAERSVQGIMRSLEDSRWYKGVSLSPVQLRNHDLSINWAKVDSVAAAMGADGIIEIESFDSQAPVGGTVLANATGQTRVPLRGSAYVNVYIAQSHLHLDRLDFHEVYNIPISGTINPLNMINDVIRKREYYHHLGQNIGYRIGGLFYSNWVWVNRTYYNKGSRELRMAKRLIHFGNWDLAEKQLANAVNSHKNKVAGRAKYNTALALEGQGRLDDALAMAERAAFENGTKLAYNYINILKRRMNEQPQIYLIKD
jgi:hypothetical protein